MLRLLRLIRCTYRLIPIWITRAPKIIPSASGDRGLRVARKSTIKAQSSAIGMH